MNDARRMAVETRLLRVLDEVEPQVEVEAVYPPNLLPFGDEMKQIREFIEFGEYGIAYESMVADIEALPFVLSGKAAVSLLELGLLLGYKTDRDEDREFDRR